MLHAHVGLESSRDQPVQSNAGDQVPPDQVADAAGKCLGARLRRQHIWIGLQQRVGQCDGAAVDREPGDVLQPVPPGCANVASRCARPISDSTNSGQL